MSDCNWEEIIGFRSEDEYLRFVQWVEEQVKKGICEELLDEGERIGKWKWDVRLFKCKQSGITWRLSCPDPGYSRGSWEPWEPWEHF